MYKTTAGEIFRVLAEDIIEDKEKGVDWIENRLNNCNPQMLGKGKVYWLDGDKAIDGNKKLNIEEYLLYREEEVLYKKINEHRERWTIRSYISKEDIKKTLSTLYGTEKIESDFTESRLIDFRVLYKGEIVSLDKELDFSSLELEFLRELT